MIGTIHAVTTLGAIATLRTLVALCLLSILLPGQSSRDTTAGRSITAIGYDVGGGSTRVDLRSTGLSAQSEGKAKVEAKSGVTTVEVQVSGLTPAANLGTEFLTYVLWAVSAEGSAVNLGEVLYD